MKISLKHTHGLGDATTFAHALSLWVQRGYSVEIETWKGHDDVYRAAGCTIVPQAEAVHPYPYSMISPHPGIYPLPEWNKIGWNLWTEHTPYIGRRPELWRELLAVRLDLKPYLSKRRITRANKWLKSLDAPLVLLHTRGDVSACWHRSFGDENSVDGLEVMRGLVDHAHVLLVDQAGDVPAITHPRLHRLQEISKRTTVAELAYLIERAALFVGIDSGPQHLTRTTDTPALAIWFDTHPAIAALPRKNTTHLTDARWAKLNATQVVKDNYQLVQVPTITSAVVVQEAVRLLDRN